jgi:hypothetical protein
MRIAAALALLWAVLALLYQVVVARGGGRRDYSAQAGGAGRGVFHAFTAAMLPTRKESVRHHPGKFAIGLLLHVGVLASLVEIVRIVVDGPAAWPWGVVALLALPAGIYLFVRRLVSPVLRAMSAPEDYLAILAVCALLVLAALSAFGVVGPAVLLGYAIPFLIYLPLGKLRHVIFFFAARADHGKRLGYRGTFPMAGVEQTHGGQD